MSEPDHTLVVREIGIVPVRNGFVMTLVYVDGTRDLFIDSSVRGFLSRLEDLFLPPIPEPLSVPKPVVVVPSPIRTPPSAPVVEEKKPVVLPKKIPVSVVPVKRGFFGKKKVVAPSKEPISFPDLPMIPEPEDQPSNDPLRDTFVLGEEEL